MRGAGLGNALEELSQVGLELRVFWVDQGSGFKAYRLGAV